MCESGKTLIALNLLVIYLQVFDGSVLPNNKVIGKILEKKKYWQKLI